MGLKQSSTLPIQKTQEAQPQNQNPYQIYVKSIARQQYFEQVRLLIAQNGLQNFEQNLNNYPSTTTFKFNITCHDNSRLTDLPLSSIYERCVQLDLKLKFNGVTQENFDQFCQQIPNFVNLQSLKFRVFSRRIQNIDNLLRSIQNIQDVNLKLNDFSKMQMSNFAIENYRTKWLKLCLENTSFKGDSLQNLTNFINQIEADRLELKINDIKVLDIFRNMKQTMQIRLVLSHRNINKEFCDKLKYYYEQQPQCTIQSPSPMIQEYLFDIGVNKIYNLYDIQITKQFHFINNRYFFMLYFNDEDFKILKQTSLFQNQILSLQDKQQSISFCLEIQKYLKQLFESVIYQIDYLFPEILINTYNQNIQHQFKIGKVKNYWCFDINDRKQFNKIKDLNKLVYVKINSNINVEEQFLITFIHKLSKFTYLISLQLKQLQQHTSPELEQAVKIIQRKGEATLRFIVFQKLLQHKIPLYHQVFYDLLVD